MHRITRIDIICWFNNLAAATKEELRIKHFPAATAEAFDICSSMQWKVYDAEAKEGNSICLAIHN